MTQRALATCSLALTSAAVLGALTAAYGLVYPAHVQHSKWLVMLALLTGCVLTCVGGYLSLAAHRRAKQESERFFALLTLVLSAFFLFVVLFGFGLPSLVLGTGD